MISMADYLQGRDIEFPLTSEQIENALEIIEKLKELEKIYGEPLICTSGYRPSVINSLIPGAKPDDAHSKCAGVDLHDPAGALSQWCLVHLEVLEALCFWMESPTSAKNHVHLQSYPPKSGKRVFLA